MEKCYGVGSNAFLRRRHRGTEESFSKLPFPVSLCLGREKDLGKSSPASELIASSSN